MAPYLPTHFQNERFVVVSRLGDGGAASVWRVVDARYNIERAVKVLHVEDNDTVLRRFEQEVRIMMRLQSPNIVTVFDSFTENDRLHIVMEKCIGSLDSWSKMYGSMPPKLAVQVMIQVLKGVQVAHEKGVVHRDIKPHNILIAEDGSVKIADFGLALLYLSPESLTKTGMLLGSLAFMAPEQRVNPSEVTPGCDIYSATMTLVWLLEQQNVSDLYLDSTIKSLKSKYPLELVQIIAKGGMHDPSERFASAQEMMQALKQIELILPESDHTLMGIHLGEVSVEELRLSSSTNSRLPDESIELKVLSSVRWMLVIIVVLFVSVVGIVFWQIRAVPTKNLQGNQLSPTLDLDLPLCQNPISSFARMVKLGPKESVQTSLEDLDKDGMLDALFVNQWDESLSIYWGNSEHTMEDPLEVYFPRSRSKPIIADFNHDGMMDFLSLHVDLQLMYLHLANAPKVWSRPSVESNTGYVQFPSPVSGMAYDYNADGRLDLYLTGYNNESEQFEVVLRLGEEGLQFRNHERLVTLGVEPVFSPHHPTIYWVEDGTLLTKNLEIRTQPPQTLIENIHGLELQQAIIGREKAVELYFFDVDRYLFRWSESVGLCRLSISPLDFKDTDYEESFGYWNDDETIDIATTRTCMHCSSNHIILQGVN